MTNHDPFGGELAEVGQHVVPAPVAKPAKVQRQPAIPTPRLRTFEAGPPVTLVLPYPISANKYWHSRIAMVKGRQTVLTYVTHEARAYKEGIGWAARAAGVRQPFPWRVLLELQLYPHRPQDWAKRLRDDPIAWDDTVQCIDLGNAEKVLSDAMNGIVFTDDKMIWRMVKDRMLPDEHGARVVIRVTPLQPIAPEGSLL